eukprot:1005721-Pleurochrysis_carterae.AAC.1
MPRLREAGRHRGEQVRIRVQTAVARAEACEARAACTSDATSSAKDVIWTKLRASSLGGQGLSPATQFLTPTTPCAHFTSAPQVPHTRSYVTHIATSPAEVPLTHTTATLPTLLLPHQDYFPTYKTH